jgi:hypothetical protein
MNNDTSEPGADGLPGPSACKGKLRFGNPLPSLLLPAIAVPIILVIIAVAMSMQ